MATDSSALVQLFLTVTTPASNENFEVLSVSGEEAISQRFRYVFELGSDDPLLDIDALLGQPVTLRIAAENASEHYRNGIIASVRQTIGENAQIIYALEVVPQLWLLTQVTDNRIYQKLSVPEILQQVFGEFSIDAKLDVRGSNTNAKRDFIVQYGETYFDFVSRLMEEEGIFYFFTHADGGHTMVVSNVMDAHQPCPGVDGPVHYKQFGASYVEENAVTTFAVGQRIVPNEYRAVDYNFKTPASNLLVTIDGQAKGPKLWQYDYPGGYEMKGAGDGLAKVRIEGHELLMKTTHGSSTCRGFVSGHTFVLSEYDRDNVNGEYLITSLQFVVRQDGYTNTFTCIPAGVPFRPQQVTPKPVMAGYQTATVVGKSGEEIWCDEFGRVVVHFPWDTRGKQDENSSCWIRVAQPWAGAGWGTLSIPRMGTEVLVAFLDGDPDRPLIVGTVYNGAQVVPYNLPGDKTRTVLKTNSSKGGGGFNEIRLEDAAGKEEIFLHAQKDMMLKVLNDRVTEIDNTNTLTVGSDDTESFQATRTITVEKADTESYNDTRTITVSKNDSESYGEDRSVSVSKDQTTTIGGNNSLTVQKDRKQTITGKQTVTVQKEYSISAKKFQITADDEIILKTGAAEIIMKKSGDITIKGKKIDVKASGEITIKGSKIKEN